MPAGRPKRVDPQTLYAFAHEFYWDFRRLGEGSYRWRLNQGKYNRLLAEIERTQLSDEQKSSVKQHVEEEIRAGRLKQEEKQRRLRDEEDGLLRATQEWHRLEAADEAREVVKIPGEPDMLRALLQARTPKQVRQICKDAFVTREVEVEPGRTRSRLVPNWPLSGGSVLPYHLSRQAKEFVAARRDRRFPRSDRPSNQLKQLWFLARALAGALFEIKARTAINLVGSRRPEQMFEESRAGKPVRRKRRKK
jgi:hypothetical protein